MMNLHPKASEIAPPITGPKKVRKLHGFVMELHTEGRPGILRPSHVRIRDSVS